MKWLWSFPFVSLLASAPCQVPQDPVPAPGAPAASGDTVLAEVKAQFVKEGIVVDAKASTVTVPAVVNAPQDAIEYLLIHKRGKRHEAVFVTTCKPSLLNAALLMVGLEQGKNATYVEKQPPPTLEEMQAGADPLIVTPPSGQSFWMTVKWPGGDGKPVEHCVEDILLDLSTQEPLAECRWVYLGGRMAKLYKNDPEVYVADFEGNLISVCYLTPDNHLATMVHERGRDDQNWWLTKLLPPPDTAVEFVFHKVEPPVHVERKKRLAQAAKDKPAGGGEVVKPAGGGG
jgi:hypothetical protein